MFQAVSQLGPTWTGSVEPGTSLVHPLAAQWDFEAALNGHLLQMGEPHAWTSASSMVIDHSKRLQKMEV
jgi:hypothetical protein